MIIAEKPRAAPARSSITGREGQPDVIQGTKWRMPCVRRRVAEAPEPGPEFGQIAVVVIIDRLSRMADTTASVSVRSLTPRAGRMP